MPSPSPYWIPRTLAMLLCALAYPFLVGPAIGELCGSVINEYRVDSSGGMVDGAKLFLKLFFAIYGAGMAHRSVWAWFQENWAILKAPKLDTSNDNEIDVD